MTMEDRKTTYDAVSEKETKTDPVDAIIRSIHKKYV